MGWGLVLLATATPLPELITGIDAVTLARMPGIARGDVLGSCVFNLSILIIIDGLHRHETLYTRASQRHVPSAGFGTLPLGIVGMHRLLAAQGVIVAIGHTPWA